MQKGKKAVAAYRERQAKSGFVRLEVKARPKHRALLRKIAQVIADDPKQAERFEATVAAAGGAGSGKSLLESLGSDDWDPSWDDLVKRDRSLPRRVKL